MTSPDLLHHHSELALPAEDGLDPRQPLDVGEDLGWTDEDLARVEPVGFVKEEALGRPAEGPPQRGLQRRRGPTRSRTRAQRALTESLTWGQMSYSLAPSSTLMEHLGTHRQSEQMQRVQRVQRAPYLAPLDSLRMMWLVRSYTFPSQNS